MVITNGTPMMADVFSGGCEAPRPFAQWIKSHPGSDRLTWFRAMPVGQAITTGDAFLLVNMQDAMWVLRNQPEETVLHRCYQADLTRLALVGGRRVALNVDGTRWAEITEETAGVARQLIFHWFCGHADGQGGWVMEC